MKTFHKIVDQAIMEYIGLNREKSPKEIAVRVRQLLTECTKPKSEIFS